MVSFRIFVEGGQIGIYGGSGGAKSPGPRLRRPS